MKKRMGWPRATTLGRSRMNAQTALLDVRQMSEADRFAVAAGISAIQLMANAGKAVF